MTISALIMPPNTFKEIVYHKKLVDAVVRNDIMVDKLILKDVQLTVANDDNYFVFEDVVLQVQSFHSIRPLLFKYKIIFRICKIVGETE